MIKIEKLWTSNNPELLRHLALLIRDKEQWYAYLTPLEGERFLNYLDDPIIWKEFINFKPNFLETSRQIFEELTVLFRVRFMLYEKAIESLLFSNDISGPDQSLVLEGLNNYERKMNEIYDFGTLRLLDDNCYDVDDEESVEDLPNGSEKMKECMFFLRFFFSLRKKVAKIRIIFQKKLINKFGLL